MPKEHLIEDNSWYSEYDKEFINDNFQELKYTISNNYDFLFPPEPIIIDEILWEDRDYIYGNENLKQQLHLLSELRKNKDVNWGIDIIVLNNMYYNLAKNKLVPDNIKSLRWAKRKLKDDVEQLTYEIGIKHEQIILKYVDCITKWSEYYYALKTFIEEQDLYVHKSTEYVRLQRQLEKEKAQKILDEKYRLETLYNESGVYFLQNSDNITKIGISDCLIDRCLTLSCANAKPLQVVAVKLINNYNEKYEKEKILHNIYQQYRYHREWFNLPQNIINDIKSSMTQEEYIACTQINNILYNRYQNNLGGINDD